MISSQNVSYLSFSELEKIFSEVNKYQQEILKLKYQIEDLHSEIKYLKGLAEIENKVYSGVKKYFK